MQSSTMYVAPGGVALPEPPATGSEVADLLRQLLEVQREHLALQRAQQAAQDTQSRWRAFVARWEQEFPSLAADCRQVLPILERAYLSLIQEMIERVKTEEALDFDNEFVLGDFLDRYGVRLSQLGSILGQIGPLAEAAPVRSEDGPPRSEG